MLPRQRQLNYQKNKVCVVNLLAAIFGDQRIKEFREKGESNTGIKNCVQPPENSREVRKCGELCSKVKIGRFL